MIGGTPLAGLLQNPILSDRAVTRSRGCHRQSEIAPGGSCLFATLAIKI